MRVYLPATTTVLRTLVDEGRLAGPHTAFAVTPQLREFYERSDAEADQEELEYAALLTAAHIFQGTGGFGRRKLRVVRTRPCC